jgi:2'-5' RNA ligase
MQMYFIAIVLPGELNKKVLKWKELMHEKYGCTVGLRSPAHITFIPPFWMDEEKEQQLIADVDTISSPVQPFTISLNNFSAFKPRTIYVDVVVNEELRSLKAAVDAFFTSSAFKIKTDSRPFHPHVTIATRDLHKKDFQEAWPLFETKKFKAEWEAKGLSVLRHNRVSWEVIHTSVFQKKTNIN